MKTVTISVKELEYFHSRNELLSILENGGVAFWQDYDYVTRSYFNQKKTEILYDEFIDDLNDVLADAEVSEPAGHRCGYAISFDEEFVRSLLVGLVGKIKDLENGS